VLFKVEGTPAIPLYPGQLVDVFIEARDTPATAAEPAAPPR
jgi:hypothetical protein